MKTAARKEGTVQAITTKYKGLTEKQTIKFIKHLRKKHPLQEELEIHVYLNHGLMEIDNKKLHGQVRRQKGSSIVRMYINTDQHDFLIYKTIAHEYRHVMQWVNQDMEWITLSNKLADSETDAHIFGQRVINLYCYPKYLRKN